LATPATAWADITCEPIDWGMLIQIAGQKGNGGNFRRSKKHPNRLGLMIYGNLFCAKEKMIVSVSGETHIGQSGNCQGPRDRMITD